MRISQICPFAFTVMMLGACGPKVDTGRNENPGAQDTAASQKPGNKPGGRTSDGSDGDDSNGGSAGSCFAAETKSLPAALVKLCNDVIKPNALLAKTSEYICDKGRLVAVIDEPACGWQGDETKMYNFIRVYERETDTTKDYADTHATIVHVPIAAAKFVAIDRLAFENYAAFTGAGYKWIAGTREIDNLNAGKMDSGIQYKIRIDKGAYVLGQAGHVQMFPIGEKTWMQVNYGDHDFELVQSFEQAVIYHELADGSSMILKFEHKTVNTLGLPTIAARGAAELMVDFMKKTWTNSVKGK